MVKTLTVKDEVYEKLRSIKKEGMSFSDLLEKLVKGSDSLETLRELRGSIEFEDKEGFLSEIDEKRKERRI